MKKSSLLIALCASLVSTQAMAGNPTRSGSAGANELLINPWVRTASWSEGNTANVSGLESTYGNIAGLAFCKGFNVGVSNAQWMVGSGVKINALSMASKTANGVLALHVSNYNYGDIEVTTEQLPDGGAGTYSPAATVLGVAYSEAFTENIFGGVNIKMYNSTVANVSATGVCFDAGVQYVAGKNRDIRFGITLRNIGPSFGYKGDGLAVVMQAPWNTYSNTYDVRSQNFELPTQLAMGVSKEFKLADKQHLTLAGNFISNSFKKDQLTLGLEYAFHKSFYVRGSYASFDNREDGLRTETLAGPAMGFTFKSNAGGDSRFALDYAYRLTNSAFGGVHTVGVSLEL